MIRAVIFDCFGVLATEGWQAFRAGHFDDDPVKLQRANELMRALDGAQITYDEFLEAVSELAGVSVEAVREPLNDNVPEAALFAYIQALKPRYKIGMLSNAGQNWLSEIFTPEQLSLFDAIALSYETGHVKPESTAYRHAAGLLGAKPAECVFVDDQPRYLAAAREVGMRTVQFSSAEQCIADIAEQLRQRTS